MCIARKMTDLALDVVLVDVLQVVHWEAERDGKNLV